MNPGDRSDHVAGGDRVRAARPRLDRGERRPGREQAEGLLELAAGDGCIALGPDDVRRDDPGRDAVLGDLDPDQAALHPASELGRSPGQRQAVAPAVIGVVAGAVVGIAHPAQPRLGRRPRPDVLDVLGVAAGAGEEVGADRRAVIGDDLTAGRRHRGVAGRRLGAHAAVHLGASIGVEAEHRPVHVAGQAVGPRGHGLRLERLRRPARGHLGRDHPADVIVEPDRVDGHGAAGAVGAELERAAIRADPGQVQRTGAAHVQGRGELAHPLAGAVHHQRHRTVRVRPHGIGRARLELLRAGVSGAAEHRAA